MKKQQIIMLKLRFAMAFIFLWAFFDKLLGLGFATTKANAWINGGSPTTGFLTHAVKGPFAGFFNNLATIPGVDWLFMGGLLFIGGTLLINKYVKWGSLAGIAMMLLMWAALLFPENNPLIDDHIVYALVLALLGLKDKKEV